MPCWWIECDRSREAIAKNVIESTKCPINACEHQFVVQLSYCSIPRLFNRIFSSFNTDCIRLSSIWNSILNWFHLNTHRTKLKLIWIQRTTFNIAICFILFYFNYNNKIQPIDTTFGESLTSKLTDKKSTKPKGIVHLEINIYTRN